MIGNVHEGRLVVSVVGSGDSREGSAVQGDRSRQIGSRGREKVTVAAVESPLRRIPRRLLLLLLLLLLIWARAIRCLAALGIGLLGRHLRRAGNSKIAVPSEGAAGPSGTKEHDHSVDHSSRGWFSAISTPIFAIKYSFFSSCRDLQNDLSL